MMQLLAVHPHKLLQAVAWFWLARYCTDLSQAMIAFEQSIVLARAAWDEPELGAEFCLLADRDFVLVSCLWDYALDLIERGDVARASPLVAESLEIFRRRENQYEIADGLGTLGIMALLQGDLGQAHSHLHEAVTILAAFNQKMLGSWQPLLALVMLYGGDAPEARRLLTESLRLCIEIKSKHKLAEVCAYLAETALWEGALDEAEQWLRQSLTHHADPHRITIYEVERLWVAARLATAQEQYQRAATLFGLADQAHSQIHYAIAGPMRALADAALTTARAALEPAIFAEAFNAGQQMSLEEAFATILAPTQPAGAL
jgi:tetratricopeptide (TPR) repeat protein